MSISVTVKKIQLSEFGKVLLRFASAQIVSNFLRLISGFLVVRAIDPEMYGRFTGIGIYMGYLLLGHGGIINGLGRELPFELGKKNDSYAKELASSVYSLSIGLSMLFALFFVGLSLYYFIYNHTILAAICLSYVIIGGLNLLNQQFLPVLYRTNKDFDSLSKQDIRFGIGNLASVLLVYYFGLYGLIARGIFLAIYQFVLLFRNKPYPLKIKFHFSHFKKLFKTGLPIFMVGQVNPLWATVMNNIIFSVGSAASFGLFSLSTIVQGAIGIIPASFSSIIYPRMAIMLGEGKPVKKILSSNYKAVSFQFLVMLVIASLGCWLLPFIVPIILPKYVDGIRAAQWMLFVPVAQSLGALNNIYNVVKKQFWYFISLCSGAIVGSLYTYIRLKHGFLLEIFSQGLFLGVAVQQILSLILINFSIRHIDE